MSPGQVQEALSRVKLLQEMVLVRRRFRGYSGPARVVGGLAALVGALVMSSEAVPKTPLAQLAGWGCVLAAGLLVNYGALTVWFLNDPEQRRQFIKLMPALEIVPCLATGGALSLAAIVHGQYQLLFGIWMAMYGLAHLFYRLSLPKTIYLLGIFYLLCGAYCLFAPGVSFTNPWPMGLTFFFGETAGGFILYCQRLEDN